MSIQEVIWSFISGFFGGTIGNIVIEKYKSVRNHKMITKKSNLTSNGDIINGNKR